MTDRIVDAVASAIEKLYENWDDIGWGEEESFGTVVAECAIAAYEAALWQPIETAPRDGTLVIVRTNFVEGLPAFTTCCAYHPDAGWCVDELREPTHWRPLPQPPEGAK